MVEMYTRNLKIHLEPNRIACDSGKKGIPGQSKAKNLLDRFIKFEEEILRFASDLNVPFENNQAERDLRMVRVQQKISGTFRTPQGADAFCRNRGYISTIMKNMMSVMGSLNEALRTYPKSE
jgi:transposase